MRRIQVQGVICVQQVEIIAEPRVVSGKGSLRALRRNGLIPAIVYGKDISARPLAVKEKDIRDILISGSARGVLILRLAGETQSDGQAVLIRDLQLHPIRKVPLHVDFLRISLDEEITVEVPVMVVGEDKQPAGDEGIVQLILSTVEVQCLPTKIPTSIEVDVSELAIGETIRVEDLHVDEGVTLVTDGSNTVVSVIAPTQADEPEGDEAEEVEGEDIEPELVGEDTEDEDE
jgi:large subunit ribosomal protein L25